MEAFRILIISQYAIERLNLGGSWVDPSLVTPPYFHPPALPTYPANPYPDPTHAIIHFRFLQDDCQACEIPCSRTWTTSYSYMPLDAYGAKYQEDPDFAYSVDKTDRVLAGEESYNGYQGAVNRVACGKLIMQRHLVGFTREAFNKAFGIYPEEAGYKMRDLPDLDGTVFRGVLVEKKGTSHRDFVACFETGYTLDEMLLQPDAVTHSEQLEKTFECGMTSDKKFKELRTMAHNAHTWEAETIIKHTPPVAAWRWVPGE